jgi:hypothetical protein
VTSDWEEAERILWNAPDGVNRNPVNGT